MALRLGSDDFPLVSYDLSLLQDASSFERIRIAEFSRTWGLRGAWPGNREQGGGYRHTNSGEMRWSEVAPRVEAEHDDNDNDNEGL